LFDEVTLEVRRFAKRPITDAIDTREPQLLAGIVTDFRVINGQRGKLGLFKLDDKSGIVEARADEALITANKNLLKDDELIIAMGQLKQDRFSGGVQFTVTQIWDLEQARCRFAKYLRIVVGAQVGAKVPDVARLLREFPARKELTEQGELVRGLGVRVQVKLSGAEAELQLGDGSRFYPSDVALAGWRAQVEQGQAVIVYE
jgi:DNA polymerase-3 subunit alpha